METSKSTLTVAREALKAGQESLSDYRHPKSPHKFTQPQLFACLVVKEFQRLDYRGIWVLLAEWSELRNVLGLKKVPHFTTLWAAGKRLLAKAKAQALLDGVLHRCRQAKILGKRTPRAAIDSTGLETRHISAYYTQRCQRHQGHYKSRYPKLSVVGGYGQPFDPGRCRRSRSQAGYHGSASHGSGDRLPPAFGGIAG